MARTLNGYTLPEGIQWTDRSEHSAVAQSVARTLSGAPVVFYQATNGLRPVTLQASPAVCWLTWEWVQRLELWRDVVGGRFAFEWDAFSATVMFAHHSSPVLQLSGIRGLIGAPEHDKYVGTIKLITI